MKLVVMDLETSGLSTEPRDQPNHQAHEPGVDPDCILEIGLVILDAETLVEEARGEWLVLPPGIFARSDESDGEPTEEALNALTESWTAWELKLKEKNPFVFDMHSKPGPMDAAGRSKAALLNSFRRAPMDKLERMRLFEVEIDICALLSAHSRRTDDLKGLHPGNSDLVFTGNSIANLDIPMLRLWMPRLHNMLSYRILDVSVLRTFYCDIAKVPLPPGLAEAIKSGGGGHRALDDALFCAGSLRELTAHARRGVLAGSGSDR